MLLDRLQGEARRDLAASVSAHAVGDRVQRVPRRGRSPRCPRGPGRCRWRPRPRSSSSELQHGGADPHAVAGLHHAPGRRAAGRSRTCRSSTRGPRRTTSRSSRRGARAAARRTCRRGASSHSGARPITMFAAHRHRARLRALGVDHDRPTGRAARPARRRHRPSSRRAATRAAPSRRQAAHGPAHRPPDEQQQQREQPVLQGRQRERRDALRQARSASRLSPAEHEHGACRS